MKLVYKLGLAFAVVIAIVLGIHTSLSIRWHNELYRADIERDHRDIGRALLVEMETARARGPAAMMALVEQVNRREGHVRIRWVAVDGARSEAEAPVAPPEALVPLRSGREVLYRDDERVYTYLPVPTSGAGLQAIELSEEGHAGRTYIHKRALRAVVAGLAMILLGSAVSLAIGQRVVGRPIRLLVAKARRVGRGDLTEPLRVTGHDEFSELTREMNAMAEGLLQVRRDLEAESAARMEAIEQLRRADRLATVGRLASGLAHELGTPLNVVSERAKMIVTGEMTDPKEAAENAQIIREQTQRLTAIVRQLLDFTRLRPPEKKPTELLELGRATLSLLRPLAEARGVTLLLEGKGPVQADVDPAQLQQALSNLVLNAVDATERTGSVVLRIESGAPEVAVPATAAPGPHVCLTVCDRGTGIPEDALLHVFEPFFTTKPAGRGTGLGLAVADGIIREHGGWINARSKHGEGSTFAIWLPAYCG